MVIFLDFKNVIKTSDAKHRAEKLKTKNQRYKNTKKQNTERGKLSFTKGEYKENTDLHKLNEYTRE